MTVCEKTVFRWVCEYVGEKDMWRETVALLEAVGFMFTQKERTYFRGLLQRQVCKLGQTFFFTREHGNTRWTYYRWDQWTLVIKYHPVPEFCMHVYPRLKYITIKGLNNTNGRGKDVFDYSLFHPIIRKYYKKLSRAYWYDGNIPELLLSLDAADFKSYLISE